MPFKKLPSAFKLSQKDNSFQDRHSNSILTGRNRIMSEKKSYKNLSIVKLNEIVTIQPIKKDERKVFHATTLNLYVLKVNY